MYTNWVLTDRKVYFGVFSICHCFTRSAPIRSRVGSPQVTDVDIETVPSFIIPHVKSVFNYNSVFFCCPY